MIDRFPPELLFHIIGYLPEKELVTLQLVCRGVLPLARANKTWRERCYDKSPAVKARAWTTFADTLSRPSLTVPSANEAAATFASILQSAEANSTNPAVASTAPAPTREGGIRRSSRIRAIADWDPSYEAEKIDWYSEYIARCAPLSVSWTINPREEVKGLTLLPNGHKRHAVGLCEDGTVRIWDAKDQRELGRSLPKILFNDTSSLNGAVDCVAINPGRGTACFSVSTQLKTVDLSTMQVVSSHDFTYPITALSQSGVLDQPLTIGTRFSVHLFDNRAPSVAITPEPLSQVESPSPPTVSAGDSCPLSILHTDLHSIYLAGRYPSILHYDRRYFPRLEGTIHSGGRLCSLSQIVAPSSDSNQPSSTLLSCGEYNGRGSLELYDLPHQKDQRGSRVYRNRQTASRSKLLSVAPHGTRIVFSDADGCLKWVERDGSSLARTWNVNQFTFIERPQPRHITARRTGTVLEFGTQGTDVVRKIFPLPASEYGPYIDSGNGGTRGDNKLLLYTGEKAGILSFKEEDKEVWEDARESFEDELDEIGSARKTRLDRDVGIYPGTHDGESRGQVEMEQAMRRALMRHADEMNWLRRFGLAPEV